MIGRPLERVAAQYYFTYINQVKGDDPIGIMTSQLAIHWNYFPEFQASNPCTGTRATNGVSENFLIM
jgi:hypothetical protein